MYATQITAIMIKVFCLSSHFFFLFWRTLKLDTSLSWKENPASLYSLEREHQKICVFSNPEGCDSDASDSDDDVRSGVDGQQLGAKCCGVAVSCYNNENKAHRIPVNQGAGSALNVTAWVHTAHILPTYFNLPVLQIIARSHLSYNKRCALFIFETESY